MSRDAHIEVRSRVERRAGADNVLDVVIDTLYRGDVTATKRCSLNLNDPAVQKALAECGWSKPVAVEPRTVDLDRELTEIAALSDSTQWPMLSHIDGDRILIGGTVNAAQLTRLAELATQLGAKA